MARSDSSHRKFRLAFCAAEPLSYALEGSQRVVSTHAVPLGR